MPTLKKCQVKSRPFPWLFRGFKRMARAFFIGRVDSLLSIDGTWYEAVEMGKADKIVFSAPFFFLLITTGMILMTSERLRSRQEETEEELKNARDELVRRFAQQAGEPSKEEEKYRMLA